MIITQADYLSETVASDSLNAAQRIKPTTNAEVEALTAFMKLPYHHQKRTLDFLSKSLSAHDDGDGVPSSDAKRNRASLKPGGGTTSSGDVKMNKLKKETEELMKELFDTPELQQKAINLWNETIESRSAAQALADLFEINPHFSLLWKPDSYLEKVEIWSRRVEQLEQACLEVGEENQMIREQMMRNEIGRRLEEEALYSPPSQRRRSMHNIADDLEGVDEDNIYLLETGDHVGDPRMNARKAYLEQTTAHTDMSSAKNYLVETWRAFEN